MTNSKLKFFKISETKINGYNVNDTDGLIDEINSYAFENNLDILSIIKDPCGDLGLLVHFQRYV